MIYFLTPVSKVPSGGIRKAYRQVDVLNQHGIPATIVHQEQGYRPWWFTNTTPVAYWKNGQPVSISLRNDILVAPDGVMQTWAMTVPQVPKVVFNQSAYVIWPENVLRLRARSAYSHPDVLGVICVSDLSRRFFQWAFPDLFVHRIHHGIDPAIYRPLPKEPWVSFMIRRTIFDAHQVLNLLRQRGALAGFQLINIEGKSETQAGEMLGQSALFLSFNAIEGFGLPPAEAMACECVVVGYHGQGGKEFFGPDHCFPVESCDLLTFAQSLEAALEMYRTDRPRFDSIGRAAGEFIRANYTLQQEEADILECWSLLLERCKHNRKESGG